MLLAPSPDGDLAKRFERHAGGLGIVIGPCAAHLLLEELLGFVVAFERDQKFGVHWVSLEHHAGGA